MDVRKLTEPPVPGRWYQVPCVWWWKVEGKSRYFLPVLGDLHEDKDIIKVPGQHWHIDWRFVTPRMLAVMDWETVIEKGRCFGHALFQRHPEFQRYHEYGARRMRCVRAMPEYKDEVHRGYTVRDGMSQTFKIPWLKALEAAFAGTRAECLRCPHRGLPLNGLPVEPGNVVTCRGHGLRWSLDTLTLVPREK